MIDIVFREGRYEQLARSLLARSDETVAIVYARPCAAPAQRFRLLAVDVEVVTSENYRSRSRVDAEVAPSVVLRAARRAEAENLALVFVHTHPFDDVPRFSEVDDQGEQHLARFLARTTSGPHAAIVMGRMACAARELGSRHPARVIEIGRCFRVRTHDETGSISAIDDRQVRALGRDGQRLLSTLRVAVVGVGGTGSFVAQELAHLGVGHLTLLDPDSLDASNLHRVVGATEDDIGEAKAKVLASSLSSIRRDVRIEALPGDVLTQLHASALPSHDFVFLCTDTHGSRAIVNQIAYQYLIPTIDIGVAIRVQESRVTHIAGRVQLLAPGLGCLVCGELLDPVQVRYDLMTERERRNDPYFIGDGEPQPAVVSFNGVVSSTAVSMFLHAITGVGTASRMLMYDGVRGTIRVAEPILNPSCVVCSESGVLSTGDTVGLAVRTAQ